MKGLETSLSTIGKQNRRQDDERDTGEKYWVSATTMALEIHDKVAAGHRPHCGLKWPQNLREMSQMNYHEGTDSAAFTRRFIVITE